MSNGNEERTITIYLFGFNCCIRVIQVETYFGYICLSLQTPLS